MTGSLFKQSKTIHNSPKLGSDFLNVCNVRGKSKWCPEGHLSFLFSAKPIYQTVEKKVVHKRATSLNPCLSFARPASQKAIHLFHFPCAWWRPHTYTHTHTLEPVGINQFSFTQTKQLLECNKKKLGQEVKKKCHRKKVSSCNLLSAESHTIKTTQTNLAHKVTKTLFKSFTLLLSSYSF